ncbi:MAG: hypothetical protein H0W84_00625, partial [Bacteroidetes bacterium]|nr:hypothetical protein [Bacteroidota bacterium]
MKVRIKKQFLVTLFYLVTFPSFSQGWNPLPMLTQQSKAAGNMGGEGCQVISSIAIDGTGNLLLMGTDVGGLYKSTDGGINWKPCNKGFKPRGSAYTAIDPNNNNRFIVVGGNSSAWDWHGIWLSTDQGESWSNTLPKKHGIDAAPGRGYNMIAYDPSTFSGGKTNTIYWSAPSDVTNGGGLFKSTDGGQTWVNLIPTMGGSFIAVHPTKGYLYVGNSTGLYKSTNGGTSFTQLFATAILGLAVTKANPDWLYIVRSFDIELSKDAGATWTKKSGNGLPTSAANGGLGWTRIHCSPINSNLLTITNETGAWYDVPSYRSKDGGDNWIKPTYNTNYVFFPNNVAARIERPAFHPTNANIIVSCSGDWICRSTDGGDNYSFSNNGNNGVLGGYFNFNPFHNNIILICTQDYNSTLTTDGGATWKYLNVSGQGWGGFNYGGYAFNGKSMYAGNASGWSNPRFLYTSFDGGQTWTNTNLQGSGSD